MKYLSQITIIAAVSFIGELLAYLVPLPVPGSIYGLVIMLFLLLSGIVKLGQVKSTGDFLITLMPVMFVGPTVGLMDKFEACRDFIVPILICVTIGTVAVMAVTGLVSQAIIKAGEKKEGEDGVK